VEVLRLYRQAQQRAQERASRSATNQANAGHAQPAAKKARPNSSTAAEGATHQAARGEVVDVRSSPQQGTSTTLSSSRLSISSLVGVVDSEGERLDREECSSLQVQEHTALQDMEVGPDAQAAAAPGHSTVHGQRWDANSRTVEHSGQSRMGTFAPAPATGELPEAGIAEALASLAGQTLHQ
jgi:hypothetical protein